MTKIEEYKALMKKIDDDVRNAIGVLKEAEKKGELRKFYKTDKLPGNFLAISQLEESCYFGENFEQIKGIMDDLLEQAEGKEVVSTGVDAECSGSSDGCDIDDIMLFVKYLVIADEDAVTYEVNSMKRTAQREFFKLGYIFPDCKIVSLFEQGKIDYDTAVSLMKGGC